MRASVHMDIGTLARPTTSSEVLRNGGKFINITVSIPISQAVAPIAATDICIFHDGVGEVH